MPILSEAEAKALMDKILSYSKTDALEVNMNGGRAANTRFGVNSANTSGDTDNLSLFVTAQVGQRSGNATSNTLDDAGLERVVRAAEEIARLRPEDPEQMPFVEKQTYAAAVPGSFDQPTFDVNPDIRAQGIAATTGPAVAKNLVAAGLFENSGGFNAVGNTKGNFAYARTSEASYTTTVRTGDGTGSGWASAISHRISDVDAKTVGERAVAKSLASQNPVKLEPGKYTVILEPNAVGDLVSNLAFYFGARQADEGRSFLSKKGGGNRLGEKLFGDGINLYTDPNLAAGPGQSFDGQGLPTTKQYLIKNGVVANLAYNRFWAKKMGKEATPGASNLILDGGTATLDDMIKSTERGVYVTRFWYVRPVDQQTVLYTGLTRDGTFLIENGKIKSAIMNFRWNETPVKMLNLVEMSTPVQRITGSERVGSGFPVLVPALKIREFEFTSLSEAI
jgi:predicted Zn-dependent protease